jgi:hypothetical protein
LLIFGIFDETLSESKFYKNGWRDPIESTADILLQILPSRSTSASRQVTYSLANSPQSIHFGIEASHTFSCKFSPVDPLRHRGKSPTLLQILPSRSTSASRQVTHSLAFPNCTISCSSLGRISLSGMNRQVSTQLIEYCTHLQGGKVPHAQK